MYSRPQIKVPIPFMYMCVQLNPNSLGIFCFKSYSFRYRGAGMIREQIEDREQRRLLEAEKKDQETQSMLHYLERLQQEDMDNLVKKREAQASLMEDVALCNEVRNTKSI